MSVAQFGFLRGRSTLQQLLIFFNTIVSTASQTDVFRKAFDSVAHNELLCKLWKFGITGDLWLWVRACLSNRVQYANQLLPHYLLFLVCHLVFSVQSCSSSLLTIFPLFSKVLLFADDAKCIMPIYSLDGCINLQTDLSRLSDWCTTWNLFLNEEKCSAIRFMPMLSPTPYNYHLNGKQQLRARAVVVIWGANEVVNRVS